MKTITEQMDASQVFCPNLDCMARGKVGQGNIVSHGKARARYRCKTCGKTFSAQAGTMFARIRGLRLVGTETRNRNQDKWAIEEVKGFSAIDFRGFGEDE